jgi:hypothetical protein
MARYQIYKDSEKNAPGKWSFTRLGPPLIVSSKFNPNLEFVSEHNEVPEQVILGEQPSDIDGANAEEEDEWSHARSPK